MFVTNCIMLLNHVTPSLLRIVLLNALQEPSRVLDSPLRTVPTVQATEICVSRAEQS